MNKKPVLLPFIVLICSICLWGCDKKNNSEQVQAKVNDTIPLWQHPRPDFEREDWVNLNGTWKFEFDTANKGETESWFQGKKGFTKKIRVPFPWGSKLSGVKNEGDIAWYERSIKVPKEWEGKNVFLVVGASDWITSGWIDGNKVGSYQGGYTPFEFDLTQHVKFGEDQKITLKVDDSKHDFKLFGKQGYGDVKGIWQTIYLEARAPIAFDYIHFTPDIDKNNVNVKVALNKAATAAVELKLNIKAPGKNIEVEKSIPAGADSLSFTVDIPNAKLWTLEDPYLYETTASLKGEKDIEDKVNTYFGMRKISVTKLPGTEIPYVALNNKPVYLQLTLDQSYHPEGFYTFPTDEFMKEEIQLTKNIGLNGQRIHIKVEVPRKLYWADKLGVLIMSDLPNSWGQPDSLMRREAEKALRGMIRRDYNHPAIFSWIVFNETWGLFTNEKDGKRIYKEETQNWVVSMYRLAKSLDKSRLVEDNSTCNYDHVETDINSWHVYLPGYDWPKFIKEASEKTFPGSNWNFAKGKVQGNQPMINSECGNVWGYEGSTGDVDWSWDYHIMINSFRAHPKIAGWLYTEHHDVINEWNGYVRYDRSPKFLGLDSLNPGMTLNDFHSDFYLSPQIDLAYNASPSEEVKIPLWISVITDKQKITNGSIETELIAYDQLGNRKSVSSNKIEVISLAVWESKSIDTLAVKMPEQNGLAVLRFKLKDDKGKVLHHNFTTFVVGKGKSSRDEKIAANGETLRVIRFAPDKFTKAEWTSKQWNVLKGLKVNGAGSGYFEYTVDLPKDIDLAKVKEAVIKLEASSKPLLGKDRPKSDKKDGDYMLGEGVHDPSEVPNSYPMTDTKLNPSKVQIIVNGQVIATEELKDDPADHQGVLSWFSQPKDKKLYEAGTYGYLISAKIPTEILAAAKDRKLKIQFKVDESSAGGLAIYGEKFGKYPIDPMIVMKY